MSTTGVIDRSEVPAKQIEMGLGGSGKRWAIYRLVRIVERKKDEKTSPCRNNVGTCSRGNRQR